MIHIMVAIFDRQAEMYQRPFFVPRMGVAYRILMDEIGRGGTDNGLAMHTKDFELYSVGQFDDELGKVTGGDPVFICELSTLKEKEDVQE